MVERCDTRKELSVSCPGYQRFIQWRSDWEVNKGKRQIDQGNVVVVSNCPTLFHNCSIVDGGPYFTKGSVAEGAVSCIALNYCVPATTQKRKCDAKRVQRGDSETEEPNCTDNSEGLLHVS
jgi:hypothetical protein